MFARYASFDHPRKYVRALAQSFAGRVMRPFDASMMSLGANGNEIANVDPFTMQPAFGLDIVRHRLKDIEKETATGKVVSCFWLVSACNGAGLQSIFQAERVS